MGTLLDPAQAAARLNVSRRTLDNWRRTRPNDPPFKKLGSAHNAPVRYDEDELRAWVEGNRTPSDEGDAEHTD